MGSYETIGLVIFAVAILTAFGIDYAFATFSSEVLITSDGGILANQVGLAHPTGVVATSNGTYFIWTETTGTDKVLFAKTTDGITFTTPVVVDTGNSFRDFTFNVDNQTVSMFYQVDRNANNLFNQTYATSTNDGLTFTTTEVISKSGSVWGYSRGNNAVLVSKIASGAPFFPCLDCIEVHTTSDGGATFNKVVVDDNSGTFIASGFKFSNTIKQSDDGNTIHVTVSAKEPSGSLLILHYARSIDGGATFSPFTKIGTFESDGQFNEIFLSGNKVLLMDISQSANKIGVFRSIDNGATFGSRIDVAPSAECGTTGDFLNVPQKLIGQDKTFPDKLHAMCTLDPVSGAGNGVFVSHSDDFGATWSTFVNIQDDPNDIPELFPNGSGLDADNDLVGYYWSSKDDQSPFDLTLNYVISTDGGNTFSNEENLRTNIVTKNPQTGVTSSGNLNFFLGFQNNCTTNCDISYIFQSIPDAVPPVISSISGQEPIILSEGQSFFVFNHVQCIDDVDGTIPNGANFAITTAGSIDPDVVGLQTESFTCTDSASNNALADIDFLVKRAPSGGGGITAPTTASGASESGGQQSVSQLSSIQPLTVTEPVSDVDRAFSIFDQLNSFFDFDRADEQVTAPIAPSAPTPEPDQRESFIDRLRDFFSSLFG